MPSCSFQDLSQEPGVEASSGAEDAGEDPGLWLEEVRGDRDLGLVWDGCCSWKKICIEKEESAAKTYGNGGMVSCGCGGFWGGAAGVGGKWVFL